jgi:protein gp37
LPVKPNTLISWAHRSWNPWVGCDKIAPECRVCYIYKDLRKQKRSPWGQIYQTNTWEEPLRLNREAEQDGVVERVFTCSLSDFFHAKADQWRPHVWNIIRRCPNLVFMVLTKRPSRILNHLPPDWGNGWPNVWLGVTAGCRASLHHLDVLRTVPIHPRAHRWISSEPLLEDIAPHIDLTGFSWLATGGESGGASGAHNEYMYDPATPLREELKNVSGRRTMKILWALNLRDKCLAEGVNFMFKQLTHTKSSYGVNALGRDWHQYPDHHVDGVPWRPQQPVEAKNLISVEQIQALWKKEGIPIKMDQIV